MPAYQHQVQNYAPLGNSYSGYTAAVQDFNYPVSTNSRRNQVLPTYQAQNYAPLGSSYKGYAAAVQGFGYPVSTH